jgi:nucleoside-triphosphatase THEP1
MKLLNKFYQNHKHNIVPSLSFAKKCVDSYLELKKAKKPSGLEYLSFGLSMKGNFHEAFPEPAPFLFFRGKEEWVRLNYDDDFYNFVFNLLKNENHHINKVARNEQGETAYIITIDGISFGACAFNNKCEKIYVHQSNLNDYEALLAKLFWQQFETNRIVIGCKSNEIYSREEFHEPIFATQKASELASTISVYTDHGISRSILFYGPPGSGKSNLAKSIISKLDYKSIRIKNLDGICLDSVYLILKVFNPDAIILEDIDSMEMSDMSVILDKLETFNRQGKLIIATANNPTRMESAIIRPGRFDEVIEINILEKEAVYNLIGSDDHAIYTLVKDWPAAFILELMKRIKAKGKEAALAEIKDLTSRMNNVTTGGCQIVDDGDDCDFG